MKLIHRSMRYFLLHADPQVTEKADFVLEDHTVTPSGWAELPKPFANKARKGRQWGLPETIDALKIVLTEWNKRHPKHPVRILDISKEGGGELSPHKSHQRGIDVDVRLMLKDPGKHVARKVSYTHEAYSRPLTQELITLFHTQSTLPVEIIWFADPDIETRGPDETPRATISKWDAIHTKHFHVRFEHPVEGRTSPRRRAPARRAEPLDRPYTGPTAVDADGRLQYPRHPRTYTGPRAVTLEP